MKIERKLEQTSFGLLSPGDIFFLDQGYYIKMLGSIGDYNAVNLDSGVKMMIPSIKMVTLVKAKVVIE